MFISTPNGILNTSHVRFIRENAGEESCTATMSDGSEKTIDVGIRSFGKLCGTITEAPKGFVLNRPILPLGSSVPDGRSVTSETIIAFRHRGGGLTPVPITAAGELQPNPGDLYVVQEPSGRCIGPTGSFDSIQKFLEDCRQRTQPPNSVSEDDEVI
ncbi:hypothetical protein [Methylobacterium flocculans]|uniref:hypothetical protein n=1 Tax=Methylobacterium flocculans TaxID=2984843 RepID=UPI0021F285E1|nr:hypothetical protein [Methylobacterium sp. FF17]